MTVPDAVYEAARLAYHEILWTDQPAGSAFRAAVGAVWALGVAEGQRRHTTPAGTIDLCPADGDTNGGQPTRQPTPATDLGSGPTNLATGSAVPPKL